MPEILLSSPESVSEKRDVNYSTIATWIRTWNYNTNRNKMQENSIIKVY